MDYTDLPQFEKYDVEYGWLLDVKENDSIEFTVEAALTHAHPLAQEGDRWKRILIVFSNVKSLNWIERKMHPHFDSDGTVDYGSIDSFTVEGDKYHLSGSWGDVEILSDPVAVREIDES